MDNKSEDNLNERIEKFLDEFMTEMYPKKDHYIARKYFRELFQRLIPKYFKIRGGNAGKNFLSKK